MNKEKDKIKKGADKILEDFLRKKAIVGEPVPEELKKILNEDEERYNGGL